MFVAGEIKQKLLRKCSEVFFVSLFIFYYQTQPFLNYLKKTYLRL